MKKIMNFIKTVLGKIIVGVIGVLIVGIIMTGISNMTDIDLEGKWNLKMDYEIFFSNYISSYKDCQIIANGDLYIVRDNGSYKGLTLLEINLIPEDLSSKKHKFITIVMEFKDIEKNKKNNYSGKVNIKYRKADNEIITKYILPFLQDKSTLTVPSDYSFSFKVKNKNLCEGPFIGMLKNGKITTKGNLNLSK